MASKNYKIGRQFEYRVLYYLRKLGYYCLRAYGSKGLYDIIAIPPISNIEKIRNNNHHITHALLIQAKSNGYIHPKDLQNLKDSDRWIGVPLIAFRNPKILKNGLKSKKKTDLKFRSLNGEEIIIA